MDLDKILKFLPPTHHGVSSGHADHFKHGQQPGTAGHPPNILPHVEGHSPEPVQQPGTAGQPPTGLPQSTGQTGVVEVISCVVVCLANSVVGEIGVDVDCVQSLHLLHQMPCTSIQLTHPPQQ